MRRQQASDRVSGETLNTLARLEALARGLEKDVVASEPGHRLALPPGIQSEELGEHELKGLPVPVRIVSLARQPNAQSPS